MLSQVSVSLRGVEGRYAWSQLSSGIMELPPCGIPTVAFLGQQTLVELHAM